MDLEEIKGILTDQREEIEEIFQGENIIERQPSKTELSSFLKYPNILAILGVRRCGKSIFSLLLLRDKKFGYINFDDERLAGLETKDLNKCLQALYELHGIDLEYIILDELQNIPKWELFANRMRRTKKIILTGSNAKLLSGELATHLTGRYIDFTLYPFSFNEHLKMKGINVSYRDFYSTKKTAQLRGELEEYIYKGGFPEVYKFGKAILGKIYESIIQKDILLRYNIKNRKTFAEISKYLISQFSNEITYTKLRNMTSIKNVHTIKNYVDYLSNAYLIFILERYSPKLKKQIIAPKKVYCVDNGIINSVAFRISRDIGRLIENTIAVELIRRKSYENNIEIYYWKDHQQREVDFVIKEGVRTMELIQVTYASGRDEIENREIKSLLKASDELKCKNLKIITWDYEDEIVIDNRKIKCIPLWKWLLL